MQRRWLKGVAETLMRMSVADGSADLYLAVADLHDGIIRVDLLRRTSTLDGATLPATRGVCRLCDWLAEQGTSTPTRPILEAHLELRVDSTSIPSERQRLLLFQIEPSCFLGTAKRKAEVRGGVAKLWVHR